MSVSSLELATQTTIAVFTDDQYKRVRETDKLKLEVIVVDGKLVKCRGDRARDLIVAAAKAIENSYGLTTRRKYRMPKLEELEVGGLFTFVGKNVLNKITDVTNEHMAYVTHPTSIGGARKPLTSSVASLLEEDLNLIDHWMGPSEILTFETLDEYKETFDNDFKTCLRSELILVMGYVVADEKYEVTISPSCLEKIMGLTSVEQYLSAFPESPDHARKLYEYMSKWNQIPSV